MTNDITHMTGREQVADRIRHAEAQRLVTSIRRPRPRRTVLPRLAVRRVARAAA